MHVQTMTFSFRARSTTVAALAVVVVCALVATVMAVAAAAVTAQTQDHQYTTQDIETGARVYARQCALCHGPNGDEVDDIDLRSGRFRRQLSDDDIRQLIATGLPAAAMPGIELPTAEVDGLVAYIRAGFDPSGVAVKVGDVARGRALFDGTGDCVSCHRVNGRGPRVAPDLSDIGAVRTPAALQRSLLQPSSAMRPINRPVRAVTRDGRTIRGRRLNEDTYTVQLIDEQERLVSLAKTDLVELEVGTTSPMPTVAATLTAEEVSDLVAYLLSLEDVP